MFRESDATAKNPHTVKQPIPEFQALSRAMRFDEGSVNIVSSGDQQTVECIPTTWDTYVDPTHRDADWAGLVLKQSHRRHVNDHRSQISGVAHTANGIASISEKEEWLRKRRDCNANSGDDKTPLIYGTGASEEDRWKTTSQRMDAHEPTERNQMSLCKRALPMRSLADQRPANSSRTTFNDSFTGPQYRTSSMREATVGVGGYSGRSGSMLSNLGQEIAKQIPSESTNYQEWNQSNQR